MTPLRIVWVLLGLLCACVATAQPIEWVTIGRDVRAFHEDVFRNQNIGLEQFVVRDVEIFVEIIGLPNVGKINALRLQIRRSTGLKDAIAYAGKGYRTIVYDPVWAGANPADFYLVLGHEAGHLICGHEDVPQSQSIELDADRFGGASIRRFEIYHNRSFFGSVMAAAASRYPEGATVFHPARGARLTALKQGYEQGSPCGNLAPVTQGGYTAGPR
jgi:hypothetical protein